MIPYLELPTLGPITSFGILAMLGMAVAMVAMARHAERLSLDLGRVRRMAQYVGVGAVLGAHYVDLFLYQPGWYERDDALWRFLNPFAGISSYGGLLGGTLGFALFARSLHGQRLRYADVAAVGAVVFLLFGRAGCASVHDHVGVATAFPFAVDFPANNPAGVVGPHHDLGLYEMVLFGALVAATAWLLRTPRRPGWYVGVVAIAYAVPRFGLDLLRRETSDPRYALLTPAQWGCIATVAAGIALLIWSRRTVAPQYAEPSSLREHIFRLR
ncbi:MAG: prolipoprotein diacylglyceryl transferase [Deltaproteobacteria bacterium]|nr:prolipoprotein diacylglyceryl transferase [Deltaproteobacteria bacterium]